MNNTANKISA